MRIGLNLLHAMPEIGGGWNYISNLVDALAHADETNEYVAYVTDVSASLVPTRRNFQSIRVKIQSRVRAQRILFESSVLQLLVRRDKLDCLHWFANGQGIFNAVPPAVTIYDLQPFLDYGQLSATKRRFLRWRLHASVRGPATLLPMSQTTADALHHVLGADHRRMTVIPPMLESRFTPVAQASVESWRVQRKLPAQFWLYVAHIYPHKNHLRLLEAYRSYVAATREPWPLVLRGDPQPAGPNIQQLVAQLQLGDHVIFLSGLRREEVPALYGAASALVFPSLYEGAGMPVLEAQACGCVVVASNIPAVREFGGDAVCHFDPHDTRDMTNAMIRIAEDAGARSAMRDRGLAQARMFRNTPVIPRLIAAYERAAKRSGTASSTN